MRRKEKLVVLFIAVAFLMLCLGALLYLPRTDEAGSLRSSYLRFLGREGGGGLDEEEQWNKLKEEVKQVNGGNDEDFHKMVLPEKGKISQEELATYKKHVVEEEKGFPEPSKPLPASLSLPANPKISDEQHKKLAEDIKLEKQKFIKEQAAQEEEMKVAEKKRLLALTPATHHGIITGGEPSDPQVKQRRDFVRKMMKVAWDGYMAHSLGHNELKPISKSGHSAGIFGTSRLGATVVDGLDTLYIMGLNDEFKRGRDWVAEHLDFNIGSTTVSVFEMNIRFVGGLLSAYAFTKDEVFKIKAKQLADKLLPAFNSPSGIPYALVNMANGHSSNYGWAQGGSSILAEFGSLHLEWVYLSKITGQPVYADKVNKIRKVLRDMDKPNGLYSNYVDPRSGRMGAQSVSIGALGDSFYEYLLKSWIQSGKVDTSARKMFDDAMKAVDKHLITTSAGGFMYAGVYNSGMLEKKMEHLACFSGGMFGLGSRGAPADQAERFLKIGSELTRTCRQSYVNTATGIGPESFRFEPPHEAVALRANERYYILRPEVVESYFVMWRLTHEQKYRDWAWDAAQAIEKHCRVGDGYSGLHDVTNGSPSHDDVQQSFFLAETLKYLYLIFSNDELVSLDEWVFNTEAHPLPVMSVQPGAPKR